MFPLVSPPVALCLALFLSSCTAAPSMNSDWAAQCSLADVESKGGKGTQLVLTYEHLAVMLGEKKLNISKTLKKDGLKRFQNLKCNKQKMEEGRTTLEMAK